MKMYYQNLKDVARKGIDEDSINNVISFHLDDKFSKEMPGAKEYVSIGYKQHKQQRLLLCNLTELCNFLEEISQFYSCIFKILCSSSKVVQNDWFFWKQFCMCLCHPSEYSSCLLCIKFTLQKSHEQSGLQ